MEDLKHRTVNVLGTEYAVHIVAEKFLDGIGDGCTDTSTKTILISDMKDASEDPGSKTDLGEYRRKVLRHELVHAFLYESGLDINTNLVAEWASNEEMVDWFAIQGPKIFKAYSELGILD